MKSKVVLYYGKIRIPVNCSLGFFFNQQIAIGNPNGTIVLKKENGDVIESFLPTDTEKICFNAHELIITPTNDLPFETKIYLYVNDSAVVAQKHGKPWHAISEGGNLNYHFVTEDPIGKKLDGGTVICKTNDNYYWIVSPEKSELYCSWNDRQNAVSLAEELTSTTGWMIPSYSEFRNPIILNSDRWHDHSKDDDVVCDYWTDTANSESAAYSINTTKNIPYINNKGYFKKVRAFKKVSCG